MTVCCGNGDATVVDVVSCAVAEEARWAAMPRASPRRRKCILVPFVSSPSRHDFRCFQSCVFLGCGWQRKERVALPPRHTAAAVDRFYLQVFYLKKTPPKWGC